MAVFATDADSGLNGQIEYSILSGNQNDAFLIDTARGIVATNAILDREIFSSYKLILLATDKGSPQLTATTTVRIQVVDVNDNAPAIPPMEPAEIAENLPAGYIVTQVSANDVDLSPALSYSFADNGNPGGKFAIDRYTGVITLTESLDYEESPQYVLQIRASDSIHETGAELRVHVLDVNDNPPVFSQASYQVNRPLWSLSYQVNRALWSLSNQVLLAELTPRDTFVLTLSTTDRDSGLNGEVSYRLLSSASKGFYISLKNGKHRVVGLVKPGSLFTSKPLRYFMESSVVQLLVEASDGGDPALTAVTSVEIQIRDINDHAPQFMQATYQVSVSEAAAVGSTVLYLSASDQDFSHDNYYLDYSIFGGNEQNRFCIETSVLQADDEYKKVGKLVLCNPLDRENTMNYTLVVVASDRGTPPLNASAVVSVTVLDANDNPPVFSQLEYHVQVSESILLNELGAQISATGLCLYRHCRAPG
ncbi:UNVERIFIED_CONTAM: hypothetical protein FKN15_020116 [Acipenser sinensis]